MDFKGITFLLLLSTLFLMQGSVDGIILEKPHFLAICEDYNELTRAGLLLNDVVSRVTMDLFSALFNMMVASISFRDHHEFVEMQEKTWNNQGNSINGLEVISQYMQATSQDALLSLVGKSASQVKKELTAIVDLVVSLLALPTTPKSTLNASDSLLPAVNMRQKEESPLVAVDCESIPFPDRLDTSDSTSTTLAFIGLLDTLLETWEASLVASKQNATTNPTF